MQDKLSLETLGQLDDGTVGAVANAAIAEALADCDDRPFLEKGRKVTVEIVINPVLDGSVLKGVGRSGRCEARQTASGCT